MMMRLNAYRVGCGVQLMLFCACLFLLSAPNVVVVVVIEGFSHPFQQKNVISSLNCNHLQHHHFRHGIENKRRIETTTAATTTTTTTTTTKLTAVKKDDDSSDEQSLLSSSSSDDSSSSSSLLSSNNNEADELSSNNSNKNNNKKSNKSIFKKIFQTIGNGVFYTSSIIITTLGIYFSLGIVLNGMGYGYEFRLHGENGNGIPGIHIDTIQQMRIDRQFDRVSSQYENESYNNILNNYKTPEIIKTTAASSSTSSSSSSSSTSTSSILMPSTTTTTTTMAEAIATTTTTMVES
jgi:hypothetical protein